LADAVLEKRKRRKGRREPVGLVGLAEPALGRPEEPPRVEQPAGPPEEQAQEEEEPPPEEQAQREYQILKPKRPRKKISPPWVNGSLPGCFGRNREEGPLAPLYFIRFTS
jgi:hypothetical protein